MISTWWESLSLAGKIFAGFAIPSTLILVLQTLLSLIGMGGESGADRDADFDADFNADADTPDGIFGSDDVELETAGEDIGGAAGVRPLTLRGIVAFFTITGWVGLTMLSKNAGLPITIAVSVMCGLAAMFGIAYIMMLFYRLQSDGTKNIKNALGKSGSVYLTIPPARTGKGKINVILHGAYTELDAVTDSEVPIPTGKEIVVIGISGQDTVVVKIK